MEEIYELVFLNEDGEEEHTWYERIPDQPVLSISFGL